MGPVLTSAGLSDLERQGLELQGRDSVAHLLLLLARSALQCSSRSLTFSWAPDSSRVRFQGSRTAPGWQDDGQDRAPVKLLVRWAARGII